jgi:hypothetical protein
MKKLIQISAILSLLIVFAAVSANAQTVGSYKANIPFSFNVDQKSYEAGDYVIKTAKLSANCVSFTVEDEKGNKLQTILVASKAEVSAKRPELVFNRYDDRRFLTRMLTGDASISITPSSAEKRIAKEIREKSSRTEVALAEVK